MGRALPQTVCDRAELLSRAHPLYVVAQLIGVHPSQVTVMKQRGWKAATHATHSRPKPNDFAIMANRMSHQELCRHYRAGNTTVSRWLKDTRPNWKAGRPKR